MVEINNQRKAFLDMLAWSEGTDNDVRKPEIMVMTSLGRRRAIYWLLRSPSQTCHAKPKTQINRRRTLPASSRWWDAYRKQLGLRKIPPKSQDAVALQQIKERGAYLWLIVVISVRQSTVAANIWASLLGAGYGQFGDKADSLIAKFKEAGGTVRDWCMSRVTGRLSPLWLSASSLRPSWAVNHYRDNAITYKAQRDKNARELKLANAAITDMQIVRKARCCWADEIHEGVSWC